MRVERLHVLILGGTSEARALAEEVAKLAGIEATISLAGRTAEPLRQSLPSRIGGFGGAVGLQNYIRDNAIDAVIDATHPYAAKMSANAVAACNTTPLIRLERAPWEEQPGDRWQHADSAEHAAALLGNGTDALFLAMGRLEMQPFLLLQRPALIRTVDPLPPSSIPEHWKGIAATGPFALQDEIELLKKHQIGIIVSKNSGGKASQAKIEAARQLGLSVIMIRRPPLPETQTTQSISGVIAWLTALHRGKTPTERAV